MLIKQNKKIVISGGPGSGKSTLIALLEQSGYHCFKEFSRSLIKKFKNTGENSYFKSKPIEFSEIIWRKRVKQFIIANELEFNAAKPYVFFDRGVHDVVAYLNYIQEPYDINSLNLENHPYEMALLLPPWKEIYVNDAHRLESFEEAMGLYLQIKEIYSAYKIPTIEVPIGSPNDRILTILELIKNGK